MGNETGHVKLEPAPGNEGLVGGRDTKDVAVEGTPRTEGLGIGVDTEDVTIEAGIGGKFTVSIAMEAAPRCIGTTDVGIGSIGEAASDAAELPRGGSMSFPPIGGEESESS